QRGLPGYEQECDKAKRNAVIPVMEVNVHAEVGLPDMQLPAVVGVVGHAIGDPPAEPCRNDERGDGEPIAVGKLQELQGVLARMVFQRKAPALPDGHASLHWSTT